MEGRWGVGVRVIEDGHIFMLRELDGGDEQVLKFVKRVGEGYLENYGRPYPGTTTQEVLRAVIARTKYVQGQASTLGDIDSVTDNQEIIRLLQEAMFVLELRADRRAGRRPCTFTSDHIEDATCCPSCGHIGCWSTCT